MGANVESLEFLNPPQGPGEIGRLGPYRILKVLGQGGMGVVFQAEDPVLERTVALKVMLPEVAKKPVARERFLREARSIAKIEHDHIVTIYQVGEDKGVPYLAMQFLKGMSLQDFLKKKKGSQLGPVMSVDQILKLGREVAKGLGAAHERGLIHRDVKPGNLWLDASAGGRVKILDFGLVQAGESEVSKLTQLGAIVGTATHMAPEQARSDKIDGRADLFSLGVVLYRLCTGRLPWKRGDVTETLVAVATETPTPVQELNPALPPKFAELITKLLSKKPADRPASAKAVVEAIQAIESEQPTVPSKKAALPVAELAPVAMPIAAPVADAWPASFDGAVPQAQRRPRRSRGAPLVVGAVLAVGFLAALAIAGTVIFVQTDTGTLKIDSADDNVKVIVEKDGKQVEVIDKKTGTKVSLHSGQYRLRLGDERKDVRLDKDQVQITRDGVVVVTITKVKDLASAQPKEKERPGPPKDKQRPPPKEKERPAPPPEKERPAPPPEKERPTPPKETTVPNPPPPSDPSKEFTNSIGMTFREIPAGKFLMGTSAADVERIKKEANQGYNYAGVAESPQHEVRITRSFFMGKFEVTQGQYQQVMRVNPSENKASPDHPVEKIGWADAKKFCETLSALADEKGRVYRLPTEAEWEYACRAGTTTFFHQGDSLSFKQANIDPQQPFGNVEKGRGPKTTVKVGSYPPNAWGLHDMHGNVEEWCLDGPRTFTPNAVDDPQGAAGPDHVMRGGSFLQGAWRSAYRKARPDYHLNRLGFRVVREK